MSYSNSRYNYDAKYQPYTRNQNSHSYKYETSASRPYSSGVNMPFKKMEKTSSSIDYKDFMDGKILE